MNESAECDVDRRGLQGSGLESRGLSCAVRPAEAAPCSGTGAQYCRVTFMFKAIYKYQLSWSLSSLNNKFHITNP